MQLCVKSNCGMLKSVAYCRSLPHATVSRGEFISSTERLEPTAVSLRSTMRVSVYVIPMHLLIIGPRNFANLFDETLIGRPCFRAPSCRSLRDTPVSRSKCNVALTSVNAERTEVGSTRRQELMECSRARAIPLL